MPSANLFELESCIDDCVVYCETHPNVTVAQLYLPQLREARQRYHESMQASDRHHVLWRSEEREEMVARKQAASLLRETQLRLRETGYLEAPMTRILYWDDELLRDAIDEMVTFLRANSSIEFAAATIDQFERLLDRASSELAEANAALKNYQRFVDLRREAMSGLSGIIGEFRVALRRTVGKRDADYQKIQWPFAIASDEGVLF